MALSCGGRLSVISGCMHNLVEWHKDSVNERSISRRKKKQRNRERMKGGRQHRTSKQRLYKRVGKAIILLSSIWFFPLSCPVPITHSRPPLPAPVPVAGGTVRHVDNMMVNVYLHKGADIGVDCLPMASYLKNSMKLKLRSLRSWRRATAGALLVPMRTVMKNLSQRSGQMV